MWKLLLLVVGVALGVAVASRFLRRRDEQLDFVSPMPADSARAATQPSAPIPPDVPSTAPDPGTREAESQATGETRYERLARQEQEQRTEVAEPLKDEPLTERLDADTES